MSFLQTLLAFLLALGPLIVFHEMGHYLAARLCGVKVLRFSIGIGKVVWSRRFGRDGTEWVVSALPLGGYVKMLDAREMGEGAIDESERDREFTSQPVWRRIAIVAAGPLANFLLAIVVLAGLYMHGVQEPTTRLRAPAEQAAAWQAGVRGGERVTSVNGEAVAMWTELRVALVKAALDRRDVELGVERDGARAVLVVPRAALAQVGADEDVPSKLGLQPWLPQAVVRKLVDGSPAQRAGLQPGDVVLAVDGQPVRDAIAFIDVVGQSAGKRLLLSVRRGALPLEVAVTPAAEGEAGAGRIGASLETAPELATRAWGPLAAAGRAVATTWDTARLTLRMIGKMITGEVSWRNVTGPITIADYAGQTARGGLEPFLGFIAFVSISLGVMNLLPIPVLDGGLLLYYSVEVLTGRPLPERISEYAQRAGVGLLVALMALAVFNDIMRLL